MRHFLILSMAMLLALTAAVLPSWPARAQVRVDPRALGDAAPTPPPVATPRRVTRPVAKKPVVVAPEPPPPPVPVVPMVPAYAPVLPVIPPPLEVPMRPAAPVTPAPVVVDAPGAAAPLGQSGLQVTFGAARADLNPATEAAVKRLAKALSGDAQVSVTAFAPANGDDPSAPRRLSLARAMAVRSVLLGEGIASPRVIVRAQGGLPGAAGSGPIDRVDIVPVPGKQAP